MLQQTLWNPEGESWKEQICLEQQNCTELPVHGFCIYSTHGSVQVRRCPVLCGAEIQNVLVCLERLLQLLCSGCSLQGTRTKGLFHPQFSQRFYLQMHIKFWISQAIPELALCIPSPLTVLVLQGQCPKPRGEPGCAALQHGVPALRRQCRSAEGAAAGGDGTNGRTRRTKPREDVPEPLQNHTVSWWGTWRQSAMH